MRVISVVVLFAAIIASVFVLFETITGTRLLYSEENVKALEDRLDKAPIPVLETNGYVYVRSWYDMGEEDTAAKASAYCNERARKAVLEFKGGKASTSLTVNTVLSETKVNKLTYHTVNSESSGLLTEFTVLDERHEGSRYVMLARTKWQKIEGDQPSPYHLQVRFRARGNFNADMKVWKAGDDFEILVATQKAGYINLASLTADGTVYPFFPSTYDHDNYIYPGTNVVFPTQAEKKAGFSYYTAELPMNADESVEILAVIVTKDQFSMGAISNTDDLMRSLIPMKRDQYEYQMIGYKIITKK
jgi:hypothetical protein